MAAVRSGDEPNSGAAAMMREWWAKVRGAVLGRGDLADLRDEIESHFELAREANEARGMSPEQARREAAREIGNKTLLKENAREAWKFPRWESFWQDLRCAVRGFRKSPGFTAAVLLTLALGIGVNTAIFSVVYAVLLRPLPYPASERLVWLGESAGKAIDIAITWLNFEHWRAENHSFEEMAGFHTEDFTLTGRGDAVLTHAGVVTSAFFELTGARPLFGRLFARADEKSGAADIVVLGYDFWNRRLGGDPGVVGTTLDLNGTGYQVVGVLAPSPKFFERPFDFCLPLGPREDRLNRGHHRSMHVLGRLRPGVTLAGARTDLDQIMRRLDLGDPSTEKGHRSYAEYLMETRTGEIRPTLVMLMGAVLLVLVLACANVSNLLLARSTERVRELAIRSAIGAGRARLARQLFTETLLLTFGGGAAGVGLAAVCLRLLQHVAPPDIPRLSEVSLDVPVLAFACVASLISGLIAGMTPVRSANKLDLTTALKEGSAASGRMRHALGNLLVAGEVAATVVLAFAAGLLVRSLAIAQTTYPGFEPSHVLALELQLPPGSYKTDNAVETFYKSLNERLRREPGVEAVGSVNCPPSAGDCSDWWYSVAGRAVRSREDVPLTLQNVADADYFRTMRIPIKAGRDFSSADQAGTLRVTIVNETLARKWWRSPVEAIGRLIKLGGPFNEGPLLQIIGVAGDVSQMGLDTMPEPEIYSPFSLNPSRAMVVMIRTAVDPGSLAHAVRRDLASVDHNIPIQSLKPFSKWLAAPLAKRRFTTFLLGVFATLAFALAGIGIYGVLNYWVKARQREIAVRMALGAQNSRLVAWAGSHMGRLVAAGIVAGLAASWAASRWLSSLVFQVSPRSPSMLLLALAAVVFTASLAAAVPFWRAIHTDVVGNLHDF
ncbi:MAG: ABC transporter permease [Acidobacteriaceae bacterium]|nr:ABC transporter permease [Acidobacteriaceae bacterium]MBV9781929.1 ABC transporter permease [Acidobacteriaceae bacterium]